MALAPQCRGYLIAGHCSVEPGHRAALASLGLTPVLDLGLRLGEGTGAVLAIPLVDAACRLAAGMATFDPCTDRIYMITPDGLLVVDATLGTALPLVALTTSFANIEAVW